MISIIIAAYNEEKNIEKCLSQILTTNDNFEVIIIDDGSNDRTYDICKKIECHDRRVRVFHQRNAGVSEARNKGIREAKGEWIMFSDADDIIERDCIGIFEKHLCEASDIIQACHIYTDETFNGDFSVSTMSADKVQIISLNRERYVSQAYDNKKQILNSVHGVYNKLFRRDFIIRNSICFINGLGLGEDLLFYMDALESTTDVLFINELVYRIWRNPVSSTGRYNEKMIDYSLEFASEMFKRWSRWKKDNEFFENMCYQIYFHIYAGVIRNIIGKKNSLSLRKKYQILKYVLGKKEVKVAVSYLYENNLVNLKKKERATLFLLNNRMIYLLILLRESLVQLQMLRKVFGKR